jgi:hypothetical protein
MHYTLSSNSFAAIFTKAKLGNRMARIYLRLACFTTSAALDLSNSRTGLLILSTAQLEQLKTDEFFKNLIENSKFDYKNFDKFEISEFDGHTPDSASLKLPEKSQDTLFTTPAQLGDLQSEYYGPCIRFRDLIDAWRGEGMPLSELTGIVSLIDPEKGQGLLNESHIIKGIGLKGTANPLYPDSPASKVSLIELDDWFSLAQFGAVLYTTPTEKAVENLTNALINNDFTKYSNDQAYLFMADVTMDESVIRREFKPATYSEILQGPFNIFTMGGKCEQDVQKILSGTVLTVIGKIHLNAETGFGGKLDTNIHIHGLSPQLFDAITKENCDQLYDDPAQFKRVNAYLAELSSREQLCCGHLKLETKQCFFKSVEKIHAIQPLINIIEVNQTGSPAHNLMTGASVERQSQAGLITTHSKIWLKPNEAVQCTDNLIDSSKKSCGFI